MDAISKLHTPNGIHLLVDFWGVPANQLTNAEQIEAIMREAAHAAQATVLRAHFHSFGEQQGVTGMLMLAESHLSIHTWPEVELAAIDIFICGNGQADKALIWLANCFKPSRQKITRIPRGAE